MQDLNETTITDTVREQMALTGNPRLLGPFFRDAAPDVPDGDSDIANPTVPLATMYGRVNDIAGRGIPGATVAVWQMDEHGLYDMQKNGGAKKNMRGRVRCDDQRTYHFLIAAPGYRELVTALYFGDDEHWESDTVFGVSASLVVLAREDDPNTPIPGPAVHYDFRLGRAAAQGSGRVGADPAAVS